MSHEPREANVDDDLIRRLSAAAPEVAALTDAQKSALWMRVLAGADAVSGDFAGASLHTAPVESAPVEGDLVKGDLVDAGSQAFQPAQSGSTQPEAAGSADTASKAGQALVLDTDTGAHQSVARRLFPSGALGRSVLALAACSAAVLIGVSVAHNDQATTQAELRSSGPAPQPRAQSEHTRTAESGQANSATLQSSMSGLTADSKKRVVSPDKITDSHLVAGICQASSPLVEGCLHDISYGGLVPLRIPAEGTEPLPTVSVTEPNLDSINSDSFDFATDAPQWSVTAWFANQSADAVSFDKVPAVLVLPPGAVSLDEQCTTTFEAWTVNGETVPAVTALASGDNAHLKVTAVCAAGTASQVPDTRVQWGTGSDRAAIFFKP